MPPKVKMKSKVFILQISLICFAIIDASLNNRPTDGDSDCIGEAQGENEGEGEKDGRGGLSMVKSYSNRIRGGNGEMVPDEASYCVRCGDAGYHFQQPTEYKDLVTPLVNAPSLKKVPKKIKKHLETNWKVEEIFKHFRLFHDSKSKEAKILKEKNCSKIEIAQNVYYDCENCDSDLCLEVQPRDLKCFHAVHCNNLELELSLPEFKKVDSFMKNANTDVKFMSVFEIFWIFIFPLLIFFHVVAFILTEKKNCKSCPLFSVLLNITKNCCGINKNKNELESGQYLLLTFSSSVDQINNGSPVDVPSNSDPEPNIQDEDEQEAFQDGETSKVAHENSLNHQLFLGAQSSLDLNQTESLFSWHYNWTLLLMRFVHWFGTVYAYTACFIINVILLYFEIALNKNISSSLALKETPNLEENQQINDDNDQFINEQNSQPVNQQNQPDKQPNNEQNKNLVTGQINQQNVQKSTKNTQENNPKKLENIELQEEEKEATIILENRERNVERTLAAPAPPAPVFTAHQNSDPELLSYHVSIPSGNSKEESYRLLTFQNFPSFVEINKDNYARGGFYYGGTRDKVICFACRGSKENLQPSHDPFGLSMHNPSCGFAQRLSDCGNIPINRTPAGNLFQQQPARNNVNIHFGQNGASINVANNTNRQNNPVYQTARPVNTRANPNEEVPFERQLANVIDPQHEALLKRLNLRDELDRLTTFARWPNHPPTPSGRDMASAGWFYLGNLDRSQCFSCGGVLRNWRLYDNPLTEHKKHFPNCKMAQEREHRNIPDRNSPSYRPMRNQRNMPAPRRQNFPLTSQQRENLRTMFPCLYANSPHMENHQNRINTFTDWSYTDASVSDIAAAGFYYLGSRDRVKCWYCNGGLQNWDYHDDPWSEHAKWYPSCEFLLQNKGLDFVNSVVERFPNLHRPTLRTPGQDVPPSGMQGPSPPVPIVDPQDQMRREARELDEALKTEVAKTVIGMGFEEASVREVMRSQIEDHSAPYQSASALLDAVMEYEANQSAQRQPSETQLQTPMTTETSFLFSNIDPLFTPSTDPSSISYLSPPSYSESGVPSGFSLLSTPTSSFDFTNPPLDTFDNNPLFTSGPFLAPSTGQTPPIFASSGLTQSTPQTGANLPPITTQAPLSGSQNPELMETQENIELVDQTDVEMNNEPSPSSSEASVMTNQSHLSESNVQPKLLNTAQNNVSEGAPEPTPEEKQKLQKRLQQLKDEMLCKVCLDQQANMVFIPCGHICCCMNCTKALRHCPICRKKIQQAVKTYTS